MATRSAMPENLSLEEMRATRAASRSGDAAAASAAGDAAAAHAPGERLTLSPLVLPLSDRRRDHHSACGRRARGARRLLAEHGCGAARRSARGGGGEQALSRGSAVCARPTAAARLRLRNEFPHGGAAVLRGQRLGGLSVLRRRGW